jgi:hypothetical protein
MNLYLKQLLDEHLRIVTFEFIKDAKDVDQALTLALCEIATEKKKALVIIGQIYKYHSKPYWQCYLGYKEFNSKKIQELSNVIIKFTNIAEAIQQMFMLLSFISFLNNSI